MKKLIIIIALAFPLILSAQEISQNYTFKNLSQKRLSQYALIEFENCMQIGTNGQAMMPYKAAKLLLPPGTQAKSVEITFSNPKELQGHYTLYPKQYTSPLSKGRSGKFLFDKKFYKSTDTIGKAESHKVYTHYLNGHSIAITHFTPLRYIPAKGKVYFYQDVNVKVITDKTPEAQKAHELYQTNERIKSNVKNYIDNPKGMSQYHALRNEKAKSYQVLVISSDMFKDKFEIMKGKYLNRGMKAEFKNVTDIYASTDGIDRPEQIRNYIIQEYKKHGIEYVLLAGDTEIIPYRGFFCQVQSSSIIKDNNIPSDLYYSSLDGNWNTNHDEKWGEIGEDDLFPEVSVARMPFSTEEDMENMINKIIKYQEQPVIDELNKPLLAGEKLHDDPLTWGSDYLDLLIDEHSDNGYTTMGIPEDQPMKKLYTRNAPLMPWGADDIIREINNGHPAVYHAGHSNTNYNMFLQNEDITDDNFNMANGVDHSYSIVYTHGCICGDFTANDCIAEEMLKIKNFATAFVGNSRYGWFNEGQTEGPSLHINREFMNAIYAEHRNNIGEAHKISKIKTAEWVNAPNQHEEGALRWCMYDCNALSDPMLAIWTDKPFALNITHKAKIPLDQATYSVEVKSNEKPMQDVFCNLIQGNEIIGSAKTDANGMAQISVNQQIIQPGEATLAVSGYNCKTQTFPIVIEDTQNPFIMISEYSLTDDNNNLPEINETINLNITFKNAGYKDAENCQSTLTSNDEYIIVENASHDLGKIPANQSTTIDNVLSFKTKQYIPDQHESLLIVKTTCDQKSWSKDLYINLNAPLIKLSLLDLHESVQTQDPMFLYNKTWEITFRVQNQGHSKTPEATANLSIEDQNIEIETASVQVAPIKAGEHHDVKFKLTAKNELAEDYKLELLLNLDAGKYSKKLKLVINTQKGIEDFETKDFTQFNWYFSGDTAWTICEDDKHSGNFCASSGKIANQESSSLEIKLNVVKNDSISFFRKVSSEGGGDFFNFYIDNKLLSHASGEEMEWVYEKHPVTIGTHVFKWEYKKDFISTAFYDRVLIDDISLPLSGADIDLPTAVKKIDALNVACYPNPFSDFTVINYTLNSKSNVVFELFTINGRRVAKMQLSQNVGNNSVRLDNLDYLKSGIYIWKLSTDKAVKTGKIVKTN